jgi:hypothetical protein
LRRRPCDGFRDDRVHVGSEIEIQEFLKEFS